MQVLFFTPTNIYSNLHEVELELMQRHIDANDEVHVILCNGELPVCEINPSHKKLQCKFCFHKHLKSLSLLSKKVNIHFLSQFWPIESFPALRTRFIDIEELKQYRWDKHFDIGYGMGSYLISEMRDAHLDIALHHKIIDRFMDMSLRLYIAIQRFLDLNTMDVVYVWNGRHPTMRPIVRAASSRGVEFYTYNIAHTLQHFDTFQNALLHDLGYMSKKILDHWNLSNDPDSKKILIASKFFEKRNPSFQGKDEDNLYTNNRFTAGMEEGKLPDDWDRNKTNIAIFNSSEDEMASISDEWINPLYKNQYEGLSRLLVSIEDNPVFNNYHFYLRMHPNLKGVQNADVERINALRSKQFTLLPPESPVNTYTLIHQANKVVSYGSSAGIEAVYWGTPSILLGKCFYRSFQNTTYQPNSHDEFIQMLQQALLPLPKLGAYIYGYFWSTYGKSLRYVDRIEDKWLFKNQQSKSLFIYEWMKKIKFKLTY